MKAKPLIFGIAAASLGSMTLSAQSNWVASGGSNDSRLLWSDPANWTGTVPTNSSSIALVFNNTTANSWSNNDLTGLSVSSITVPATFNAINIKDNNITGNAITLTGAVSVSTGNFQTFGMNIGLASGSGAFSQSTGQTTFSGQISGSEAISKTGGGTVVFSGPNNFSGNVTVSGGALSVTNNSGLGTTAGKTIAKGGRLQLSNNVTISDEALEIEGNGGNNELGVFRNVSGSNTWTGNIATTGNDARIVATAGTLTISGKISSNNATNNQVVFRSEGGTIELTDANTYAGATRIFGAAASGTGATASAVMVRLSGGDNRLPIGTTVNIGGAAIVNTMEIANISQEVAGLSSVSNANSRIMGTGNATLVVNNSADGIFTGALTDSLAFTKAGAASYTLSGNNNYSRGTTINGGTLKVSHAAALGIGTVNLNAGSGAVLQLATDGSVNAYNLTMGSNRFNTIVSDKATASTAGIVHALGTLSIGSSTLTINKGVAATGTTAGVSFTSVDLSAGNNDRSVIFNGDGVISLGSVAALSNNVGFTGGLGNGGTVAAKVLQLDGTNASNAVTGVISDTNNTGSTVVSLVKANNSIWSLSGINTYTGTTTIKAGTLKLGASASIDNTTKIIVGDAGPTTTAVLDVSAKTGGFTINSSQTLSGIGTIDANTSATPGGTDGTKYTVTINGTHAVGNSPGTQTIDGNLSYSGAASIFEWDLNATNGPDPGVVPNNGIYDQVTVTGDLGGAGATFKVVLGTNAFADTFWNTDKSWSNIFNVSGTQTDLATIFTTVKWYEGATDMTISTATRGSFSITGSTLTWTAVPEPTSALAGLLLTAGLLRRRRA
jgi:autotransporter-associated beta strand protein